MAGTSPNAAISMRTRLRPMPIQIACSAMSTVLRPIVTASATRADVVGKDHDVGRLARGGRAARTHGDADVRGGEHGCVVDAVADHRDRAVGRVRYELDLVDGEAVRVHVVDSERRGDVLRRSRGRRR